MGELGISWSVHQFQLHCGRRRSGNGVNLIPVAEMSPCDSWDGWHVVGFVVKAPPPYSVAKFQLESEERHFQLGTLTWCLGDVDEFAGTGMHRFM